MTKMPEISPEQLTAIIEDVKDYPFPMRELGYRVARDQRELQKDYRKVPSVEEILKNISRYHRQALEKGGVKSLREEIEELHRWLMEER